MRLILGQMLKKLGFEVAEASSGREALERLKELGMVRLALVDWNMPDMDGLEFVRAVRADPTYGTLPIIMATAEENQTQLTKALEAGANGHVPKPYTKELLQQKLDQLGITPR
jgi:two-component system chemotaxis response regulator CheY